MKYFLDTNIIIYSINGKYPSIQAHFLETPSIAIAVPSVVVAEIEYGARKSQNYFKTIAKYRSFIQPFEIIPFADTAALEYGKIRSDLEKRGCLIGPNDMEIASICIAEQAVLVTHNVREFSKVRGLIVEDWTK